uniref:Uncharacterized protein n=1 Tax=Rhizobium meliloti TaxID=382 RepID=I2E183_RHIML|nr:short hypothetical protein [Sinorhizobium meliloti]
MSRATRPSPLIVSPEIFRLVTKLRRSFSEALVCSGIAAAQRWRIVYEATSAPQPEFELPGVSGAAHVEGERLSRRAITFVAVPANMACRRSSRARAERPVPSLTRKDSNGTSGSIDPVSTTSSTQGLCHGMPTRGWHRFQPSCTVTGMPR